MQRLARHKFFKQIFMKLTIILTMLIILFPYSVFAGGCSPIARIYFNPETKVEKKLPCGSLLDKFTGIPFQTTSFGRSEIISDMFCQTREISSLLKLTIQDFSIFDIIKILVNILFALALAFLPLTLFIRVHKKIKQLWMRVALDVLLVFGYAPWLFILWVIILGGFC